MTPAACPKPLSVGPSTGSVIGGILFGLLLVYFAARTAFNCVRGRERSWRAIPHAETAVDAAANGASWICRHWPPVSRRQPAATYRYEKLATTSPLDFASSDGAGKAGTSGQILFHHLEE